MRSKNSAALTASERAHMERLRMLPCSVCDAPGPSFAHHINQGHHFTAISVCESCHTSNFNGIHGQKRAWIVRKLDEISALNITLKRLNA